MKKFIIGVLVGIILSAIVFVPLLLSERRDKFQHGRYHGIIAGRLQAAEAIEKEFGRYDDNLPYKVVFSIKTTDVVSTETNGVKTVRVIP